MIFTDEVYADGVVIERYTYDTTAHTITTEISPDPPETRAMTPEETTVYDARAAAQTNDVNTAEIVAESDPAVDKLIAVVEALNTITAMTNASINSNPAAIIKDVVRELKTVARQLNHEVRLTAGRTESTDTGTVVP